MSENIRKTHREALQTEEARQLYTSMMREQKRKRGEVNDHIELIVYNICREEDIKQALDEDIRRRGAIVTVRNGKQTFTRQNKSIAEFARIADKQMRLSAKLGMTPGGEKNTDTEEHVETLDDFED